MYSDSGRTASNSSRRVFVTGYGVVSPLGWNVGATTEALRDAKDCVSPVESFDVSKSRCQTAGQVPDSWLTEALPTTRRNNRLHRGGRMLILSVREALGMAAGCEPELMVISTSAGEMGNGERFFRTAAQPKRADHRATLAANYMPQKAVLDAQSALGLHLPTEIISNACASGTNSIGYPFELMRAGLANCVICGGYDPLAELVFYGFDCLHASTPERIRPFDRDRTGLVLGEGAAVLVLESEDALTKRRGVAVAEVLGYGAATDTYHLTQPDPSGIGAKLAMERALRSAQLEPDQISYINAHGTATPYNDATEGAAITQLFGRVPVSSTKSAMGHALGAAGAIEAVVCLLALREQFLPPNLNFRVPEPEWTFDIIANESRASRVRTALSNSIGFGGTNGTIILGAL